MKTVVIVLIVVVVLLLVGYAVAMVNRRKQQQSRNRAGELRQEAQGRATGLRMDETRVREDEAAAAQARAEAEGKTAKADRLEALASERQGGLDVQRGRQEDAVRSADQIDPDVDHTAPDYRPEVPETRAGGGHPKS
jgi:hypothetical protein